MPLYNPVSSASIPDNTIVNADINSSAAIAYSKLNLTAGLVNGDVSTVGLTRYDRTQGAVGMVAPSRPGWGSTSLAFTANRGFISRFVPSRNMTITVLGFVCSTLAGADDAVDLGLYDASLARLVSSGATAGKLITATGVKTVTVASTPLTAGTVYYAGISCGTLGGSAGQFQAAGWGFSACAQAFGSAAGAFDGAFMDSAHPLPTTFVSAGGAGGTAQVFVRES